MYRIAIVDPNEESRGSLRTLLLSVDFVWLEAESARYEFFFDVIKQSVPDVVLVNLDGDKSRSLTMISQLTSEYPSLAVIVTSSDSQLLLQSLQRGAKYFLTLPINLEDLVGTLRKALSESVPVQGGSNPLLNTGTGPRNTTGTVISVLGTRGGVGCTTLAVNLAATLAEDTNNNVGVIDLDLALGDADIAVELPGRENSSIADLARNIERLDMSFLKRAMIKHPETGISVLRHPLELNEIGMIHEGHIERILNLLKITYSHLILDLSKSMLPTDIMSLRMSDAILLMTQLELSSLRNVVRLLHSMSGEPELLDRIRVVANRIGSEFVDGGITIRKAEEVIGRPVYWQLPNDTKPVFNSRVIGMPMVKSAPKAKYQQSIHGLVAALLGKPAQKEEPKRRGWFN